MAACFYILRFLWDWYPSESVFFFFLQQRWNVHSYEKKKHPGLWFRLQQPATKSTTHDPKLGPLELPLSHRIVAPQNPHVPELQFVQVELLLYWLQSASEGVGGTGVGDVVGVGVAAVGYGVNRSH